MKLHLNPLLVLFGVYALACWLFFAPMLQALHMHWVRPNDLDAGYPLLAVSLYVFWQLGARSALNQTGAAATDARASAGRYSGFAVVAVILCLVAASLTSITANKSVTLALLLLGFVPLAVSVWGWPVFGRVVHGCAIVLMATPIWFVLVPTLQALTAHAVNWLLQLGHWPVFVEDNMIALPNGVLEIAAGCAGLKFVQTALALTLIEGYLARRNWSAMLVLGGIAAALAIVCNWLRVSAITLLALYLDIQHPWVADHNWVGWAVFVLLLGPFFFYLGRVRLFDRVDDFVLPSVHQPGLARAAFSLVIGMGGAWGLTQMAEGESSAAAGQAQLAAARALCEPGGAATSASSAAPAVERSAAHPAPAVFPGAQLVLDCRLKGSSTQFVSLRGYLKETQGFEVINPENELLPGLSQLDFRIANARSSGAVPGHYDNDRYALAYGFYAAGAWTATPELYKLYSLARPLKPGPVWALIVLGPSADPSLDAAFLRLSNALDAPHQAAAPAVSATAGALATPWASGSRARVRALP